LSASSLRLANILPFRHFEHRKHLSHQIQTKQQPLTFLEYNTPLGSRVESVVGLATTALIPQSPSAEPENLLWVNRNASTQHHKNKQCGLYKNLDRNSLCRNDSRLGRSRFSRWTTTLGTSLGTSYNHFNVVNFAAGPTRARWYVCVYVCGLFLGLVSVGDLRLRLLSVEPELLGLTLTASFHDIDGSFFYKMQERAASSDH
jgi:hypothetical protein